MKKAFTALISIGLLILVWSVAIEPGLLIQRDVEVSKWPVSPLRIAFFSDLHAGAPYITESYIEDLISRINKMQPDIVLIGGDLVITGIIGGSYIPIEKIADLLKKLNARLGVYAVLGNHDWWDDGEHINQVLKKNGIKVLENEAELISIDPNNHFWLVGVGDDFTNHSDIRLSLSKVNTADPQILFMHDPAAIFQAKNKFDLALAGHLHGGQVFVPGVGAIFTIGDAPREWAEGWVDFKYGSLFVSKGIGTSIFPVRLNALPEFVVVDLKKNYGVDKSDSKN
ncbi:metallophosphoesterase [Bdellovibrio bacteriovorus]|uniref:metallophosphoesterase n=1 Tax=Bdellovibrio TaxID=958 RepID=UPI0035A9213D